MTPPLSSATIVTTVKEIEHETLLHIAHFKTFSQLNVDILIFEGHICLLR